MCAFPGDESLCDTLESYARTCVENGGELLPWRRPDFCPLSCPEGAVYKMLTSACPNTCVNPTASNQCMENEVEGCECEDGKLFDGEKCVSPRDCGCRYAGKIYKVRYTCL
ncbi:von Willebrand factor-like [Saccoglossus kowalevskii]